MKAIIYISIVLLFLLTQLESHAQQDIHFAQFYELPMLRNPALAGIFNGKTRFTAAYRNQWESITVPYRTMALGSEVKIFKGISDGDFITLGLQITNDVAGDSRLQRTQILPVVNYHKLLNEDYATTISLAFMGGLVSENFDLSKLKFDDQFVGGNYSSSNPTSQTFSRTSFKYYDMSTGMSFTSFINDNIKMYVGASLFHVNNPKLSFMMNNSIKLNRKWGFNGGFTMRTNANNKLVVYGDHFRQGPNRITQAGFLYTHNFIPADEEGELSISAGAVIRLNDAFIPVVKLNKQKFGIGVSYDANISSLRTASNFKGGFELTLSLLDPFNRDNSNTEQTKCPKNNW